MHQLKYGKSGITKHFILSTNSYMFWYQGAIRRQFITNRGSYVQHVLQMLVTLSFVTKI